jgi:CheY-like chemotaxis protein
VKVDPSQLQQVVMNLVLNARDAMPHGGVLTIQTCIAGHVSSEGSAPPGSRHYVLLQVADTGLGMNPETQARIFEPFFTTKDTSKGTGLGLPTVYGIVNQSGGQISVHSQLGYGTAFNIFLPLVQEELQPAEESIPQPAHPQGNETVLLIEDDAAVLECMRTWLAQWGFNVLCAGSGEEAIEIQGRHEGPIHLMLTDVVLPGAKGPEVAKRIAELRSEMRVIYMSGYADTAVQYLEKTTSFVRKPVRMTELAAKVRMVLDSPKPQSDA